MGSNAKKEAYFEFSWRYILSICDYLKSKYHDIPYIVVFPKSIPGYLNEVDGNFDVFGVDRGTPIEYARDILSHKYTLQGNMEPCRLYDKKAIKESVENIINKMKGKHHIFNLGHEICRCSS